MNKREAKVHKKSKVKKAIASIFAFIFVLILFFVIINLTGVSTAYVMAKHNIKPVVSERVEQGEDSLRIVKEKFDGEDIWSIYTKKFVSNMSPEGITEDSYLKILQLTDLHFSGGFMAISKDGRAMDDIKALVTSQKPDLIIVTGDALYPIPVQGGSINNAHALKIFTQVMNSFKIPWAFVYGNHDTESFATHSKLEISKKLEENAYNPAGGKYCLFIAGPDFAAKKGGDKPQGNYQILVKDSDTGNIKHSLIFMDSNKYFVHDDAGFSFAQYDAVHNDQIKWYEKKIDALNLAAPGIASSVFIHIPLPEYRTAWETKVGNKRIPTEDGKYGSVKNDEEANKLKYFGGDTQEIWGESAKTGEIVISSPDNKKGLFPEYNDFYKSIAAKGHSKFVFCGHDHDNNFSIETADGVRLTYGKSIDHLAYIGITKRVWQRGATIIYVTGEVGDQALKIYQKSIANIGKSDIIDMNNVKEVIDKIRPATQK